MSGTATDAAAPAAELSPEHAGPFFAEDGDFVVAVPEKDGQAVADAALAHGTEPAEPAKTPADGETPAPKPEAKTEPATPPPPAEPKPKKTGIDALQERLNTKTREEADARRAAEIERAERIRIQAELDALRSGKPATPAADPAKPAPPPPLAKFEEPEPELDQFNDQPDPYAAYTKAYAKWSSREAVFLDRQERARDEQTREAAAREARERAQNQSDYERFVADVNAFSQKVQSVAAEDPEAAVILDAWKAQDATAKSEWEASHPADQPYPGTQIPPIVHHHLLHSDHGPALFLHFAEHPEDLHAIAAIRREGPMLVALGRIEAAVIHKAKTKAGKSAAGPAAAAIPVVPGVNDRPAGARTATPAAAASRTSAPAPPPAVGAAPTASGESLADADYETYRDKRNAQEAQGRPGRRARPSADL